MKKLGLIISAFAMLAVSCSATISADTVKERIESTSDKLILRFLVNDRGIYSYDEANIGSFHPGAEVDALITITNNSTKSIIPNIYVMPKAETKDGFKALPAKYAHSWVSFYPNEYNAYGEYNFDLERIVVINSYYHEKGNVPPILQHVSNTFLKEIQPGDTGTALAVLYMPQKAKLPGKQWEFEIDVTASYGMLSMAVGSNWLVTMR